MLGGGGEMWVSCGGVAGKRNGEMLRRSPGKFPEGWATAARLCHSPADDSVLSTEA
jgi:hypothetical protein